MSLRAVPSIRRSELDVFGLGQCCIDYLGSIPEFPPPNVKCEFCGLVEEGGGPVATALVALSRWGWRCTIAGVVGDDRFGRPDPEVPRSGGGRHPRAAREKRGRIAVRFHRRRARPGSKDRLLETADRFTTHLRRDRPRAARHRSCVPHRRPVSGGIAGRRPRCTRSWCDRIGGCWIAARGHVGAGVIERSLHCVGGLCGRLRAGARRPLMSAAGWQRSAHESLESPSDPGDMWLWPMVGRFVATHTGWKPSTPRDVVMSSTPATSTGS